jgi:hypothetical protein
MLIKNKVLECPDGEVEYPRRTNNISLIRPKFDEVLKDNRSHIKKTTTGP